MMLNRKETSPKQAPKNPQHQKSGKKALQGSSRPRDPISLTTRSTPLPNRNEKKGSGDSDSRIQKDPSDLKQKKEQETRGERGKNHRGNAPSLLRGPDKPKDKGDNPVQGPKSSSLKHGRDVGTAGRKEELWVLARRERFEGAGLGSVQSPGGPPLAGVDELIFYLKRRKIRGCCNVTVTE